jgi:hypothetical protein
LIYARERSARPPLSIPPEVVVLAIARARQAQDT